MNIEYKKENEIQFEEIIILNRLLNEYNIKSLKLYGIYLYN